LIRSGLSAAISDAKQDRPTDVLARDMGDAGIRAIVTCVDPCGERGEFHTFVWDAPGFATPITVDVGDIVDRDGFVFCDVLPV